MRTKMPIRTLIILPILLMTLITLTDDSTKALANINDDPTIYYLHEGVQGRVRANRDNLGNVVVFTVFDEMAKTMMKLAHEVKNPANLPYTCRKERIIQEISAARVIPDSCSFKLHRDGRINQSKDAHTNPGVSNSELDIGISQDNEIVWIFRFPKEASSQQPSGVVRNFFLPQDKWPIMKQWVTHENVSCWTERHFFEVSYYHKYECNLTLQFKRP